MKGQRRNGQIIQKGSGKYLVRAYRGRDAAGKRKYASRLVKGTKRDAAAALRELEGARDRGLSADGLSMTLNQYLDGWLRDVAPLRLRERTVRDYTYTLDRYVRPALGEKKLARLTPSDVQQMVKDLAGRGLTRTVKLTHSTLSSALSQAVRLNLIQDNPCRRVELPRQRRREASAMEGSEIRAFLKAVSGTRYEAVFVVMVGTGMRPSEVLGLGWEDVDLDAGSLRVRRVLELRGCSQRMREGRDPFEEPKTEAGRRVVDLPPPVVAAQRGRRARQGEQRLLAGSRYCDPYGLVFTGDTGRPLGWANLRAKHFKPALKRAGIPEGSFRAYDLRHTFATQAIKAGTSPRELQERMGHSDINVTLGTYVHPLSEQRQETTDKIAARVFGE